MAAGDDKAPKKTSTRARPPPLDPDARKARAAELAKVDLAKLFAEGDPHAPLRCIAHGESGIGKTNLFSAIPGVVFLAMENGVHHSKHRYRGALDTYDELMLALDYLHYGKHPYTFVVLETLADIERRIVERIEARLRSIGGPVDSIAALNETDRGAGYNLIRDEWQLVMDKLQAIRTDRNMGFGLTAHTRATTVAGLHGGPDHQRYEPQFSASTAARSLVKGSVDMMVYLGNDVSTSKNASTGKVTAIVGNRWIHCTQQATHDAKCRGPIPWPKKIPFLAESGWRDLSTLYKLINEHGQNLAMWLLEEAAKATDGLPPNGVVTGEQRKAVAMTGVFEALEDHTKTVPPVPKDPNYLYVWDVIEQSKAMKAEAAKNGATAPAVAVKPAAVETTT